MPIKNALSSLDIYVSCVIQWKNIGNKLFINTESLWMHKNKKTTNDDVKYTAPLQDPTFTTVWLLLRAAWFGSKKVVQLYNQESLCKQRIIVMNCINWHVSESQRVFTECIYVCVCVWLVRRVFVVVRLCAFACEREREIVWARRRDVNGRGETTLTVGRTLGPAALTGARKGFLPLVKGGHILIT